MKHHLCFIRCDISSHDIVRAAVILPLLSLALSWAPAAAGAEPWAPPAPPPDDYDWVQLKSGEWLKGRIKALLDRKMEFDSEELDDLQLKIEDIIYVRSGREFAVRSNDGDIVDGMAVISGGLVMVSDPATGDELARYPCAQLQGLTPAAKRERDNWTAKISASLSVRSGNTSSTDGVTNARFNRRTPSTRKGQKGSALNGT